MLLLKCIHCTHINHISSCVNNCCRKTYTSRYICLSTHPLPHTHIYTHIDTHVNRHIIHTFLVMQTNEKAVYPFLGRKKIRKRSLIYHDIAYVKGYHFREQNLSFLYSGAVLVCQRGILNNAKILHYKLR